MPWDKEKRREYCHKWYIEHRVEVIKKCAEYGHQYRARHQAERAESHRKRRVEHRNTGLCTECNAKAILGMSVCLHHLLEFRKRAYCYFQSHREIRNLRTKQRRDRYRSNGRCIWCGSPIAMFHDELRSMCINCSAKSREKRQLGIGRMEVRNAALYKAVAGQS